MHYFKYKGKTLFCENISVAKLMDKYGTPLFIYSQKTILDHFNKLKKAFSSLDALICYSVKVNSNICILNLLTKKGSGLDIVSGGELFLAKQVGCPGKKIVYASVGKTDKEIKDAINYEILMFNVESIPELKRMNRIARQLKKKPKVALRFNPNVDAKTHKYITTGKKENKFGMDEETVKKLILNNQDYSYLDIVGLHMHIGSQITQSSPYINAIKNAARLINFLKKQGIALKYLNIGGGLGIIYDKEKPQTAKAFAKKVLPLLKKLKLKIILEPGRFIVGNAGILASKVTYVKETRTKKFIIVDAAMNDLLRPSLYGAYHNIMPVVKSANNKQKSIKKADVVGPICESGDFLGKDRLINVEESEGIAVFAAGAYAFSMSSNYNSRPRAAEVLVRGSRDYLIRKRETYKDLINKEIIV